MEILKAAVVGLGKQSVEDHLPALVSSEMFSLEAVCDVNDALAAAISEEYGVPGYTSLEELLDKHGVDVLIVAVPHVYYADVISAAAERKIHVIKEKPFAVSMQEASDMQKLMSESGIYIGVTLQRRFNPIFQSFHQLRKRIGRVYLFEGKYTFNIQNLGDGWRAWRKLAGGGVLIDMGYHFVDLLVWYFGLPTTVTARLSRGNRESQLYDVEDTAHLQFDYVDGDYDNKLVGHLLLSRVYPRKEEELLVHGTQGSIAVRRGKIERLDVDGNIQEVLERTGNWQSAAIDQLEFHGGRIAYQNQQSLTLPLIYHEQILRIATIEAAYRSDRDQACVHPSDILSEFGFASLISQSSERN